ncbi:hypothetical protein [Sphingobacterium sp. 1.A.4]|uniref:hypothetical protein n=1 Tax=Sphingobacterium sp. 1.A.4 TaxID=2044603 RepID=UPI000C0BC3A1|nr:hypothetical protein [Sphingobacterium sp. 1.A.4]
MERLTIKELAPYLPYKLQWKFEGSDEVHEVMGIDITDFGVHLFSPYGDYGKCRIDEGKPLLRHLSSLTKEIEHNGEMFVPKDKIHNYTKVDENGTLYVLVDGTQWQSDPLRWDYETVNWLISLHFDVFGLIDRGLALPIDEKEVEGE